MNSITNNYARILCRLQYTFYRASFLIVIRIHRGINTTNRSYWSKQQTLAATGATGTTATKPPPERQPPPEPSRSLALELLQHSHWSRSNDSHRATGVDRTTPTGATGTTATGATGTTATGVDRQHWSHCNGSHRIHRTTATGVDRTIAIAGAANDSHWSRSNARQPNSGAANNRYWRPPRRSNRYWSLREYATETAGAASERQIILEEPKDRQWSCCEQQILALEL